MRPSHFREAPDLSVFGVGTVLFAVWNVVPTMPLMAELLRCGDEHRDSLGGRKQAFVNVAKGGMPSFTDAVRKEAARHASRSVEWRRATAHVVLIRGLRGVAVRTFLGTMVQLARPAVPTRIFDDIGSALTWLSSQLDAAEEWTPARLLAAYDAATGRSARNDG